ncbi:ATP-binding protein [Streptomyces virginiae]|uniref:ATP-binding protein n=1 Tax=Streptomyces virginiae TaxID=1961 RepID=UPI003256752B
MARISHISDDGCTAFIELRNGNFGTVDSSDIIPFNIGDVVFIDAEGSIHEAPQDIWTEDHWVGITKLAIADRIVVEVNGRLRLFPNPPELGMRAGQTVEGKDSTGIIQVISEKPIKLLLDDTPGDAFAERFIVPPDKSTSFDDFGGYKEIVDRARELIELPLKYHNELSEIGARAIKGVLFTGPSGTGKTLLARIIANHADATFYAINGPEILSKWYGQSEEIIRGIFEDAKRHSRAIIFFDEIDSLASQRGDDSHEASRRLVGQLLSLMDGFSRDTNVMVIGTTNRPQDIDSALRRPGRFDWQVHFPIPNREDREKILQKSSRKLRVGEELPHSLIAGKTEKWTPAELAAIWTEAALLAVSDERTSLMTEDYLGGFERVARQRNSAV